MKGKRTLPPTKVGRRLRGNYERTQKKDLEAIDAALKRKIGDDGFRPRGRFRQKSVAMNNPPSRGKAQHRTLVFLTTLNPQRLAQGAQVYL
jgi:hypothetical protein